MSFLKSRMRNVFDQYDQPENKLTHGLVSALSCDRKLIRPFLKWLGEDDVPPLNQIQITQQQIPGREMAVVTEDDEGKGLPDGCFYDNDDWAVLLESKVQATISVSQLRRHRNTCARCGYGDAPVYVLAVDKPVNKLPKGIYYRPWKEVYAWFCRKAPESIWARRFAEYVEVFETKTLAKGYDIRGTLTMFNGFHFDDEHPYTYREGKRLLRLMREEFCNNKKLVKALKLDSKAPGRPAITRGAKGMVWDVICLKAGRDQRFSHYPHLTTALNPGFASAVVIIPNSLKGLKSRLKEAGLDEFRSLLTEEEKQFRPILKRIPEARPTVTLLQRHYRSQRSHPEVDGKLEVDLRALVKDSPGKAKYQPEWIDSMYSLMTNKQSNIQMLMAVEFPYTSKTMQSEKALDVMADSWIAMKPLLDFFVG